jgi:hypothetical protein
MIFNPGDIVALTIENGDSGYAIVLETPEDRSFPYYVVYSMLIEEKMSVFKHEMTKIDAIPSGLL